SVTDNPRPPSSDAASHRYLEPFVNSKYLLPFTFDWCAMNFRPSELRIAFTERSRISSAALSLCAAPRIRGGSTSGPSHINIRHSNRVDMINDLPCCLATKSRTV